MSNRRKGDRGERELSNWLEDECDYYAQRTAASGRATDRARPDVIASTSFHRNAPDMFNNGPRVLLIEVKGWSEATGMFERQKLEELREIASRAGGEAWVVIKPDLRSFDQWHCFPVDDLHETPSGNYSVRKKDLPGKSRSEAFENQSLESVVDTGP